ncbi:DUF2461 domain-containing protein [Anditalea andensis]|uniref:TIGR02453 family protein n=1 Tax=Anditalea andensis TaxID=1048983 RepID=A0A074LG84_9BACT|nr:DUF2461 domain-containing protein [Anditalea andensis]KEO72807.1 hypothetical protein EL17_14340 [Anditalea andensis]
MNKNTLIFLEQLSENNQKAWMDENKSWYLEVKEAFVEEVGKLLNGLIEIEPGMANFKPKDCVFRQNRDVRFSANKMPYKINMAAYFALGGKKSNGPGYYLHIQPGKSFVGGGLYMPPADILKRLRQEIDYSGEELRSIITEPSFQKAFEGLKGEQLKTSPRDYDQEHPHIDLLRYKSFEVFTLLPDDLIKEGKVIETSLHTFSLMQPFMQFLYRAVDESESGDGLL